MSRYDWRKPCTEGVVCNHCGHLNRPHDADDFYNNMGQQSLFIVCLECDEEVGFTLNRDDCSDVWLTLRDGQ